MPEGVNISSLEQRREIESTRFVNNATEFYLHEARDDLRPLEEVRASREALGAAAFTKTPPLEMEKSIAELAVKGIVRSGAWIEYARHDYLDRNWNLEDKEAA